MIRTMKKIIKWFKNLFSVKFITPVVDEKLKTAVDDAILAESKKREELRKHHYKILMSYLKTYFDHEYACSQDMQIAYEKINKQWMKHCRDVNSTDRLIKLNKDNFKKECEKFIAKVNAKQLTN